MKKRQKPIRKSMMYEYEGEIEIKPENEIIDYSILRQKNIVLKEELKVIFDSCDFIKCNINNDTFRKSEFIDCIFNTCDMSNNTFTECTFIRCEFINCKLIGSHFVESSLRDILFKGSKGEYLDMSNSKFVSVDFIDSVLKESNWFENELINSSFSKVNLSKAYIYNTPLKGIDLSDSDIDTITIDQISVKGIQISSWQASIFCKLLGIKVKE